MNQFSIVLQCGKPVAALVPERLSAPQLQTLYAILPRQACQQTDLADRWSLTHVFAPGDWATEQRRRVPMSTPKQTVKLAFV